MCYGYFIVLVEILGFFYVVCLGLGNNLGNILFLFFSNIIILNNMFVREIL